MPFTDVPPSYESTISRSPWPLIAPYIPSASLCAASLVSRKWHAIFIPFLWGDPASHFGIANDAVYVALTRFKKTLRRARLSVRSLTHTLHLPPALSEIYGGPNPTWLRDVLEWLPSLQSLIVTRLPFFDHHALVALRSSGLQFQQQHGDGEERWELPTFGLKLLLASMEPNTTSIGLSVALPRFPNLVYLDLSFTKSARDAGALACLGGLHDLQALKLQGIGMRDGEAEVLANAIGIRVRLLDIRDNHLTDMAVRSLLQACFVLADRDPDARRLNTRRVEDWPVGMAPGPDFFSLDTLRSEDLDHELLKQLTNPLTGRLAFEDIPHRGLTHLYISGNQLSVEGLASLIKSQRLHVLDGGTVDTVKTISRSRSLSTASGYVDEVKFPGAEKLVPILAKDASNSMTYLRVDHAVITAQFEAPIAEKKVVRKRPSAAEMPTDTAPSPVAELPGDSRNVVEMPAPTHYAVEMPAGREPIYELDATPAQPRAELPGDMIYFALSPPIGNKPEEEQTPAETEPEQLEPIRGVGPYAPEVVVNDAETTDEHTTNGDGNVVSPQHDVSDESSYGTHSTTRSIMSPISPATPHGTQAQFQPLVPPDDPPSRHPAVNHPAQTQQPLPPTLPRRPDRQHPSAPTIPPRPSSPSPAAIRQSRIDHLLSQRPSPSAVLSLHPSHLPNLRSLTLTNLPLTVPANSSLVDRLTTFISACALESHLSILLAATDYSLPPGRARHSAQRAAAKRLFALQCITLEMAQPTTTDSSLPKGDRAWKHSRQRLSFSKSSTGDMDSENLWTAAADDFSFFAEEGGEERDECGIYEHEKDRYFPSVSFDNDKIALSPDEAAEVHTPRSPHLGGTLSPIHALGRAIPSSGDGGTVWQSPRQLPMGRNRRPSNEHQQRPSPRSSLDHSRPHSQHQQRAFTPELPGTTPTQPPQLPPRRTHAPTSTPNLYITSAPIPRNGTTHPDDVSPPISPVSSPSPPLLPTRPPLDVIALLSTFRKSRKAAYDTEMAKYARFKAGIRPEDAEGLMPPFVEGYWAGEIKVVKNAAPKGRSGVVDHYGNYFEKGYLYP